MIDNGGNTMKQRVRLEKQIQRWRKQALTFRQYGIQIDDQKIVDKMDECLNTLNTMCRDLQQIVRASRALRRWENNRTFSANYL